MKTKPTDLEDEPEDGCGRVPAVGDEYAFVAAIMSNPADQTTWLVYADWLDEHGHAVRAELIRARAAYSLDAPANAERVRLAEEAHDAIFRETLYGDEAEQANRKNVLAALDMSKIRKP